MRRGLANPARWLHRSPRSSPLAGRFLLACASCALLALALVALELVARWWAPGYLTEIRGIHVFSPTYGWAGRPGAVALMGDGRVSLNARGYRGRRLALPREGDHVRVVVLGDSIAFGYGVSDEQAFPHLLDVRDNGLEVGNLAVEGYGPAQELLLLRNEGLREDPDVVVLALCLRNDLVDAALSVALYNGVTPRPRYRLVSGRLVLEDGALRRSPAERALQWLVDDSHLFNRLLALVPPPAPPEDVGWRRRKQQVLRDEAQVLRLNLALVLEMQRVCHRHGVAFLVAAFPSGLDYEAKPGLQRRFLDALESEGVTVVDMGARFDALGVTPAELSLDRTGHLAPKGHALSAKILEAAIAGQERTAASDRGD